MERRPQRRIALLSVTTLILACAALMFSLSGRQPVDARVALFGPPVLRHSKHGRADLQRLPALDADPKPQRLPPTEPIVSRLPRVRPQIGIESAAQSVPFATASVVRLPSAEPGFL